MACAWCRAPIPAGARADSVTCSKRCRQARWRFLRDVGDHPDFAGEVDHAALVSQLATFDGWALSTSVDALPAVLALCPPGTRVAAWVRGERPTKSYRPLNAWEPVLYFGGRAVSYDHDVRRVDTLVYHAHPRLTDPDRVVGSKPAMFARWMFDLLGAQRRDDFTDLYPGSGGVGRAWAAFCRASTPDPSGQLSRQLAAT